LNHQQITIVGRVGEKYDTKFTKDGQPVQGWSMAVTEKWKDNEETTWFRVVAFKRTAEVARDYVEKGQLLLVVGRIKVNEWTDNDGNKRKDWQVICDRLQLGTKAKPRGTQGTLEGKMSEAEVESDGKPKTKAEGWEPTDDDVPFSLVALIPLLGFFL